MNVSDIELFKKSKIIEIRSVEKKLWLREVIDFYKKAAPQAKKSWAMVQKSMILDT